MIRLPARGARGGVDRQRLAAWILHAFGAPVAESDGATAAAADTLAAWVRRAGLALPAALFAELQRPLFFAYGQLLRAAGPVLPPAGRWASLLEDSTRMDVLLRRLTARGRRP